MNKNEMLIIIKENKEVTNDFMDLLANFILKHFDDSPEFAEMVSESVLSIQKFSDQLNAHAIECATKMLELEKEVGE